MKTLDLRFGNPAFLFPYWEENSPIHLDSLPKEYQWGKVFEPLDLGIQFLHSKIPNLPKSFSRKNLVIAVGATQALQAAMYAVQKKYGAFELLIPSPHFSRFKDFAALSGSGLRCAPFRKTSFSEKEAIELHTLPNNPDNDLKWHENPELPKILDLCYAWPQYSDELKLIRDSKLTNNPRSEVAVFSLAKATGHASSRVGWAFCRDRRVAEDMRHFVELQTSGIAVEAQSRAAGVLWSQLERETVFDYGAKILKERRKLLEAALKDAPFTSVNDRGMFWWGYSKDPSPVKYLEEKLNLLALPGRDFGVENSDRYFRVNLGCSAQEFSELIQRLDLLK
jgi:L-tryptophan---pyruvate aminotransferase